MNKKGYAMPNVIVHFPPKITPSELIQKAISKYKHNGKISRTPNAFITYRMAFCKELHLIRHPVITQPQLSALIRESWKKEPEHIRREYYRIAKEAKDLFTQTCMGRNWHLGANPYSENSIEHQDKNNTVQQFLENDFYQGASFDQNLQANISTQWFDERSIDAATHSPFPLEKNTLMPYPSSFSYEYNPINESSFLNNINFHTSIEHSSSTVYSDSKNSNIDKVCDCGCPSCKDRIRYLENHVAELQEILDNSRNFVAYNNT
ncbi:14219_t:CDS:1 [Ambispora leptoticha]|uniref:14219_t:CDS:1 n=1 Tax=Ambispora leptoticha TaxID=144679 RepID=A0A9N9BRM5_9GLOM|nr:14219_t:CDS:1 [Ambispora leptoticha]